MRPEIDASSANQDQDQDHQETQEMSPQDIADGTTAPTVPFGLQDLGRNVHDRTHDQPAGRLIGRIQ